MKLMRLHQHSSTLQSGPYCNSARKEVSFTQTSVTPLETMINRIKEDARLCQLIKELPADNGDEQMNQLSKKVMELIV